MLPSQIQICGKLILFGEWAVLEGHAGVGCTLNKVFKTKIEARSDKFLNLSTQGFEESFSPDQDLSNYSGYFKFFLKSYLESQNPQLFSRNIRFEKQWRHEEGLGSSSAALLSGALAADPESIKEPFKLWDQLLPLLKAAQNGKGSGFDLALQIFGEGLYFKDKRPQKAFPLEMPPQIFLLHNGDKLDTTEKIKTQKVSSAFLKEMGEIAESFYEQRDWQSSIRDSQKILRQEGIINDSLDLFMEKINKSGLIKTWKSCGAGGGDSILCYSENPQKLIASFENPSFWWSYPLKTGHKAK